MTEQLKFIQLIVIREQPQHLVPEGGRIPTFTDVGVWRIKMSALRQRIRLWFRGSESLIRQLLRSAR